jgi:hypothetical protein
LVAVERGRRFFINVVVRPGMVALRSSARRSVDAGGEHMIWWIQRAYLAAYDIASMLAATAAVDNILRGRWVVVADGLVAWTPGFLRGTIHRPVQGALVATDYGVSAVADGAVDLCKGYRASSVAHSDNGE